MIQQKSFCGVSAPDSRQRCMRLGKQSIRAAAIFQLSMVNKLTNPQIGTSQSPTHLRYPQWASAALVLRIILRNGSGCRLGVRPATTHHVTRCFATAATPNTNTQFIVNSAGHIHTRFCYLWKTQVCVYL